MPNIKITHLEADLFKQKFNAMFGMWGKIKYIHSHISLYLRNVQTNICNKIQFTFIFLYFLLQQQFHVDIIKVDFKVDILTMY
jgi:hypothetical protein